MCQRPAYSLFQFPEAFNDGRRSNSKEPQRGIVPNAAEWLPALLVQLFWNLGRGLIGGPYCSYTHAHLQQKGICQCVVNLSETCTHTRFEEYRTIRTDSQKQTWLLFVYQLNSMRMNISACYRIEYRYTVILLDPYGAIVSRPLTACRFGSAISPFVRCLLQSVERSFCVPNTQIEIYSYVRYVCTIKVQNT